MFTNFETPNFKRLRGRFAFPMDSKKPLPTGKPHRLRKSENLYKDLSGRRKTGSQTCLNFA